jgi:hypothetical protein
VRFEKDISSSGISYILFFYVDKALTIKGRLKTTASSGSYTRNSDTQWDVDLQAGWNKVQDTVTYHDTSLGESGSVTDFTSTIKNAPADISVFKWTLEPDFWATKYPFDFDSTTKTVKLDITRQDPLPLDDPGCDSWVHGTATTFPADGKWYRGIFGSPEWIEIDTASKTLEVHSGSVSSDYTKGTYHAEGDTLTVRWKDAD